MGITEFDSVFSGFHRSFDMFSIMFSIVFLLVISVFVIILVKALSQWHKNNNSPRLTVNALIVAKRTNVQSHHHNHGNGMHHTGHTTTYYVTFQVESGDRLELQMSGSEFGLLIEGDKGKLTFQGTRFLSFERT